jgi:hypothetical protein
MAADKQVSVRPNTPGEAEPLMKVVVRQLYRQGTLLSDRAANNDATRGALNLHKLAGSFSLHLYKDISQGAHEDALPPLLDAVCETLHGNIMLWRGFQRGTIQADRNAPTFLQRWSVTLL